MFASLISTKVRFRPAFVYTFSMSLDSMEKRFCAVSPSSLSVPFIPIKILSKPVAGLESDRTDHIGNFLATFSGNNLVKVLETPAKSN